MQKSQKKLTIQESSLEKQLLEQKLFQAAKNGDFDLFQEIIDQGIDPSITDEHELSAVYYFILQDLNEQDLDEVKNMLSNDKDNLRQARKRPSIMQMAPLKKPR